MNARDFTHFSQCAVLQKDGPRRLLASNCKHSQMCPRKGAEYLRETSPEPVQDGVSLIASGIFNPPKSTSLQWQSLARKFVFKSITTSQHTVSLRLLYHRVAQTACGR